MEKILQEVFKHPVTAQVFAFLRRQSRPVGVREMQKELNLGSSSTSHYHLNKLVNLGVASQRGDNSYELTEPYASIKEIPLPVVLDHYIIGGAFYPKMTLIIAFQLIMILAITIMLIFNQLISAVLASILTLLISTALITRFFLKFK